MVKIYNVHQEVDLGSHVMCSCSSQEKAKNAIKLIIENYSKRFGKEHPNADPDEYFITEEILDELEIYSAPEIKTKISL